MYSKILLCAAAVLAAEAVQIPMVGGRADLGPGPHMRPHHDHAARHHEQQFHQFVLLTRKCLGEVFPKSGLPEDQQKTLLDMIRPINDLEREQRIREQRKLEEQRADDNEKDKAPKTPARPIYTPPPPPFKCEQGEIVHLTPAEIYVRAMVKILEKTDIVPERQKAQEAMNHALPCMDTMFKKEFPKEDQANTDAPETVQAASG